MVKIFGKSITIGIKMKMKLLMRKRSKLMKGEPRKKT
jgi:hypothetical protein